jgi:hypothetical protein
MITITIFIPLRPNFQRIAPVYPHDMSNTFDPYEIDRKMYLIMIYD